MNEQSIENIVYNIEQPVNIIKMQNHNKKNYKIGRKRLETVSNLFQYKEDIERRRVMYKYPCGYMSINVQNKRVIWDEKKRKVKIKKMNHLHHLPELWITRHKLPH